MRFVAGLFFVSSSILFSVALAEDSKKCPAVLDVMFSIDNTSSMGTFIESVKKQALEIMEGLNKDYPGSRFGLTTFDDKDEILCSGATVTRRGTCIDANRDAKLTYDIEEVEKMIHKLDAKTANHSTPEDSLLGMWHSIKKQPWRFTNSDTDKTPTLRFIMTFTDASYHEPGSEYCKYKFNFVPFDGKGDYDCGKHQHISPKIVFDTLKEHNVTPLFFVERSSTIVSQYKGLLNKYYDGRGLALSINNVAEIKNIIESEIAQLTCEEAGTSPPEAPPITAPTTSTTTEKTTTEAPIVTTKPSGSDESEGGGADEPLEEDDSDDEDDGFPVGAVIGGAAGGAAAIGLAAYGAYAYMNGTAAQTSKSLAALNEGGFMPETDSSPVEERDQLARVGTNVFVSDM